MRAFLDEMKSRHLGVSSSITAALANVNPYTLFDQNLHNLNAEELPVEVELE